MRTSLEDELREATDDYLALCRRHRLIRPSEPLPTEEILAAVPENGALILPVVTDTSAFAFVVADTVKNVAVVNLPLLSQRKLLDHLA